jgi:hypothetical protein
MEAHREVIGYIGCGDRERVVAEIVALCERAGLRRVPEAPLPVLGPPPSREGLTTFAVLPGAPGWHVVLPSEVLCESTEGRIRFVALCEALGSPGVFLDVSGGSEAAAAFECFGQVTLACDGRGEFALSGYMWRSQAEEIGAESPHLQWFGQSLQEEKMQESDLSLVHASLPIDCADHREALLSEINEAAFCGDLARRLAGPSTARHWREGWPWRLVEAAMEMGDAMPIPGGVILSVARVDVAVTKDEATAAGWPGDDAMLSLTRRAQDGDADAQFEVGGLLRTLTEGAPHLDLREVGRRQLRAATWFRQAAEQGHAGAQYWLGRAHYLHEGAPQDWSEAWYWLQRSAAQGNSEAIAFLEAKIGDETRMAMMQRELKLPPS